MKNILIAWELGEGFGHIGNTLVVARALAHQGCNVSFAVRDASVGHLIRQEGFHYVRCPLNQTSSRHRKPFNYSELLLNNGFDSPNTLATSITAWQALFEQFNPDIILADHAPTAIFAAHLAQIRTAMLGGGFFCPPTQTPYPNMVPWIERSTIALQATDNEVSKNIAHTATILGSARRISSIHEVFDVVPRYLCTFAELDHYRHTRTDANYFGPIYENVGKTTVEWPQIHKKNIFVYITGRAASIVKLMRVLEKTDANIIVSIRGVPIQHKAHFPDHIRVAHVPIDIASLLNTCDLVINHASLGTVSTSLVYGVPMLLSPLYLEQAVLCHHAVETNTCLKFTGDETEKSLHDQLLTLLHDNRYKEAAAKFSARYAGYSVADTAAHIAAHMLHFK